jgi:murein DD-endopeptidase MepM/ murein hydrolase activator NlpD
MPQNNLNMKKLCLWVWIFFLTACSVTETIQPSATLTSQPSVTPTRYLTQTPTMIMTTPTSNPSPTATPLDFEVCCPLEEETFTSLPLIVSKPLDIPPFGQDIGHHGVDFAYFQRDQRDSIQGIEVYAILAGSVALTLEDNYPYGFAIMIETPLSALPEEQQVELMTGYLPVPEDPDYRLYCPEVKPPTVSGEYSVYHLYAHFEEHPTLHPGDPVQCGDFLGTVGNTGYSSNPHLHLETRLGPSGADIQTMAHYENTATVLQMSNYCLWRLSGYYQLFDPFILFTIGN